MLETVDAADAERMLAMIAEKTRVVYTGVTLQHFDRDYRETRVAESEVRMLEFDAPDGVLIPGLLEEG